MDNIFEILIYVIIIISFLSSIFKKKKQLQQKPPLPQSQTDNYYKAQVEVPQTEQKANSDILRELEDFFKVGDQLQEQQKDSIQKPDQTVSIIQNKEMTESSSWHSPTASEHSYSNEWDRKRSEVKKIISTVDSGIAKKAALFEQSLGNKETAYSSLALAVKSKMKTPSTLKEFIIFSEILGKPKALRR